MFEEDKSFCYVIIITFWENHFFRRRSFQCLETFADGDFVFSHGSNTQPPPSPLSDGVMGNFFQDNYFFSIKISTSYGPQAPKV